LIDNGYDIIDQCNVNIKTNRWGDH